MSVSLRPAIVEDAVTCGAIWVATIAATAERQGAPAEVTDPKAATERLASRFARSDVYSVVVEVGGRVIGCLCLSADWPIAGVGPLAIDPAAGDDSVGRRLMENALKWAKGWHFAGVRSVLDASDGRSLALLTKLGFVAREPLSLLRGPINRVDGPRPAVRRANDRDLEDCDRLCLRVHGFDRGQELGAAIRRGTATVAESGGRIIGYATALGCTGHAVGRNNAALIALIGAATTLEDTGLLLPTRNCGLLRWCLGSGLQVARPMILMSVGLYKEPAGAFLPSILY